MPGNTGLFVISLTVGLVVFALTVQANSLGLKDGENRKGVALSNSLERSIQCDICQDVVGQIDAAIKSNDTINELIKVVEGICVALEPLGLSDECWVWYEENAYILPQFFEFILGFLADDFFEAGKVCEFLQLCPESP